MYRSSHKNLFNSSAFSLPFRYIYNILYRRRWHLSINLLPAKGRVRCAPFVRLPGRSGIFSSQLTPSNRTKRKFINFYLFCPSRQLSNCNVDVEKNQTELQNDQNKPISSQQKHQTTDNNISDDGVIIVNTSSSPTATPKPTSSSTIGFIDDVTKLSTAFRRQSVFFRVSCALVICVIVISVLTTVALLWYYMGWMYGVQAIVVAVIAVLGASGIWHWFGKWLYVAALTAPRDAKWVTFYSNHTRCL